MKCHYSLFIAFPDSNFIYERTDVSFPFLLQQGMIVQIPFERRPNPANLEAGTTLSVNLKIVRIQYNAATEKHSALLEVPESRPDYQSCVHDLRDAVLNDARWHSWEKGHFPREFPSEC